MLLYCIISLNTPAGGDGRGARGSGGGDESIYRTGGGGVGGKGGCTCWGGRGLGLDLHPPISLNLMNPARKEKQHILLDI